jgi:sugar phosphate isomerase/epimerase
MSVRQAISRLLGTMVAYGFPRGDLAVDLAIADRLGARLLEVLPDWSAYPDPAALRARLADAGFFLHSAHGAWGGQSIQASRVDLGDTSERTRQASIDDLKRCADWLSCARGTYLVVHPGGLSDPELAVARRAALAESLIALANHVRGSSIVICVENMPAGVHPGSRMADLASLVSELGRPELALALDTGHANITSSAVSETEAAGPLLRTTHVHDNNGRSDSHDPPGLGSVDWESWLSALDLVEYQGPIMLECIRNLRERPDRIDEPLLGLLSRLTRRESHNNE